MAWDFLYIVRRVYQGDNNWGDMYMNTADGKWEWQTYTYELPWKSNSEGKSLNNVSRVKIGIYELNVRTDGNARQVGGKGWRLELKNTGHRTNIQIHRAAASMYIEGCILPVHFNTLQGTSIQKGDIRILNKSVELMDRIEARYNELKKNKKGDPTLNIAAKLPPRLVTNKSHANV